MTKAILLDIEGTTTPIDFVHDTLFPYAEAHIGKYVETHFDRLRTEIDQLLDESAHDATYTIPFDPTEPGSVTEYLLHLISHDRKSTPLKAIQGLIWRDGYELGELRSAVYDDVPRAFERWGFEGKTIAIYSSGSVLAQKLLFRFTDKGDLTGHISAYFDTETGAKRETTSYQTIVRELHSEPSEILFVSDIAAELDAAGGAGMGTALCRRGAQPETEREGGHRAISSFDEI